MRERKIHQDTAVEAISANTIVAESDKETICESNENVKRELEQLTEDKN